MDPSEITATQLEEIVAGFISVDMQEVFPAMQAVGIAQAAVLPGNFHQLHVDREGSRVMTNARTESDVRGVVQVNGLIDALPVNGELTFELDPTNRVVRASLALTQPYNFSHTWNFNLGRASASIASFDAATILATPAISVNHGCVLRCGGLSILTTLITCLPFLAGGPGVYTDCVLARAGITALRIAACILRRGCIRL